MKKNKKTYLLLGLVLAIWGFLGFRILKTVSPSPSEAPKIGETGKFVPAPIKKRDTFSIVADYRDPFLGTWPKRSKSKKHIKVQKKKEDVPERNIVYTGFIEESGSGNSIFFVTIDGRQQLMTKNDEREEVKLLSGDSKKIKVRVHGKSKIVPLTQ